MNVTDAVVVFKRTQPELDAMKPTKKLNEAARDVLKSHMKAKGLSVYRGISLQEREFEVWDEPALREKLGAGADTFRIKRLRAYFALLVPAKTTKAPPPGLG